MAAIIDPHRTYTVEIDEATRQALLGTLPDEGQVIVHVSYQSGHELEFIRIWPTTFLIPRDSGSKSKLVTAENITLSPQWMLLPPLILHHFTLVFSPLSRDCRLFDLVEDIPQPGAFRIPGIRRNDTDVYFATLESY